MDYFKHYSTAAEGNTLNHLFDEFGHQGYACWFLLLELCANNWDGKSEPEFRFYESIVRKKLRISSAKLQLFLNFCSTISELSFNFSGKNIEIRIPMLAEIKESRGRISGNKSKKIDIYRIDKEEEKDIGNSAVIPEKNLPEIQSQDFRNSKDPVLETAEKRQRSIHKKLADKGSILSPEWIVIEHYNAANGKNLKQVASNYKHIKARIKEGFAVEEMKELIDFAAKVWAKDPFWASYNVPSTLFGGKMDQYLDRARNANKPKTDPWDDFFAPYMEKFKQEGVS